jgi:hypothetical protein
MRVLPIGSQTANRVQLRELFMAFMKRLTSIRSLMALILAVALVSLAACNSDDGDGAAQEDGSDAGVETNDGATEETPEEDERDQSNSNDDQGSEEEDTGVEGATSKQQKRIDKGKPTLLIRAPEDGAQVESPMKMRFDVLNGQIVKNSADEDGYVIFVTVGKSSSSLIPIYDDEGEIPLTKNGTMKVTAMLGGKKGPIKKTAVTITVTISGAEADPFELD